MVDFIEIESTDEIVVTPIKTRYRIRVIDREITLMSAQIPDGQIGRLNVRLSTINPDDGALIEQSYVLSTSAYISKLNKKHYPFMVERHFQALDGLKIKIESIDGNPVEFPVVIQYDLT